MTVSWPSCLAAATSWSMLFCPLATMMIDNVIARRGCAAAPDLTVTPLGGGITNLNYRVDALGEAYVVRIPGQDSAYLGIDRAREHACSAAAHGSGVAPRVVGF